MSNEDNRFTASNGVKVEFTGDDGYSPGGFQTWGCLVSGGNNYTKMYMQAIKEFAEDYLSIKPKAGEVWLIQSSPESIYAGKTFPAIFETDDVARYKPKYGSGLYCYDMGDNEYGWKLIERLYPVEETE